MVLVLITKFINHIARYNPAISMAAFASLSFIVGNQGLPCPVPCLFLNLLIPMAVLNIPAPLYDEELQNFRSYLLVWLIQER